MADCKIMRRKSGDTLSNTGTSSNNCGRGGFSGTRSKSYHRHQSHGGHHHASHYHPNFPNHQGCNYFNGPNPNMQYCGGFPPGPPPGPSSSFPPHPPQHHCQFLSPGGGNAHFHPPPIPSHHPLFAHHQIPNTMMSQEPPPRPWIHLGHTKHKRTCFTVLCYNILCSRYATHELYSYCPAWALDWNYRRKAILQELVHYAADIISLQEMETDQFYNFFLPQLQLWGYSGIFGAKSRARNLFETKRKSVDGCAIFYRTSKFKLLSEHLIEFNQVAIANASMKAEGEYSGASFHGDDMLNRVQTKDNIALVALLETKMEANDVAGLRGIVNPRPKPLLIATCHIHWDPNFCDVKLVQTMMLMKELRKISETLDQFNEPSNSQSQMFEGRSGSSSSSTSTSSISPTNSSHATSRRNRGGSKNAFEKVNLLVCGDFNSLPQSGVVQFMENGKISNTHPDFKGMSYNGKSRPPSAENASESGSKPVSSSTSQEDFKHDFALQSAYPLQSMPFTNYTLDFQGVIDYIFHSTFTLRPLGILGHLDPAWLVDNNVVGAPHPCIPSDHLPLLVELEMVPAI